jgi:hypothetical protein
MHAKQNLTLQQDRMDYTGTKTYRNTTKKKKKKIQFLESKFKRKK